MKTILTLSLLLYVVFCNAQFPSDSIIKNIGSIEADFIYDESELVAIPGTHVKLQAPEHFLVSKEIPGLIHPGTSTTVQVQEIIGTSYVMIQQAMTPEHFESQGVTLVSSSPVKMVDGKSGILYLVEFKVNGFMYERLMLFAGDYNNTIWINANYPQSAKELLQDLLTKSLLTAQYIDQL
ncbi:MAG: hypothetical protein PHH30_08810 [Bacteroidales bacterium]|nr:hypothetical protein [Bacteroidales bacterium]MDD3859494.1 hypothetical protein [Bacteroidales bacterium]